MYSFIIVQIEYKLTQKYSNGTDKQFDAQCDETIIERDSMQVSASIDIKHSVPSNVEEVFGEALKNFGEALKNFGEATINESDNTLNATLCYVQQYDKVTN